MKIIKLTQLLMGALSIFCLVNVSCAQTAYELSQQLSEAESDFNTSVKEAVDGGAIPQSTGESYVKQSNAIAQPAQAAALQAAGNQQSGATTIAPATAAVSVGEGAGAPVSMNAVN